MAVSNDVFLAAGLTQEALDGADCAEYLCETVSTLLPDLRQADDPLADLSEAVAELLVGFELCDEPSAAGVCARLLDALRERGALGDASGADSTADADAADGAGGAGGSAGDALAMPIMLDDSDAYDAAALAVELRREGGTFGNTDNSLKYGNSHIAPSAAPSARAGAAAPGTLGSSAAARAAAAAALEAEARAAEAEAEAAVAKYMRARANQRNASRDIHVKNFTLLAPDGRPLLESASLRLAGGRKYGLLGQNGAGKSTLLRAISSYELVGFPHALRVVHVRQEGALDLGATPLESVLKADVERRVLLRRRARLERLLLSADGDDDAPDAPTAGGGGSAARAEAGGGPGADDAEDGVGALEPSDPAALARAQKQLSATLDALSALGADTAEARACEILAGLGLSERMRARPVRELSGGWRVRVCLAAALFVQCDLLLLDEPTNHLDFVALRWLTTFLRAREQTALIVSHDRAFLDEVCTDVVSLHRRALHAYRGDVSTFVRVQAEEYAAAKRAYDAQQAEVAALQAQIDKFDLSKNSSEHNKKTKRTPSAMAQVKNREAALRKMEEKGLLEDPDRESGFARVKLAFPQPPALKRTQLVALDSVAVGYDKSAPLLRGVSVQLHGTSRVGVLGANGAGKTTLLRVLEGALAPLGGDVSINRAARVVSFAQHHVDQLDLELSALEHIMARFPGTKELEARTRLAAFGLTEGGVFRRMRQLSGGQKSRVSFCELTWEAPHLVVLDEPTNHLDLETIEVLIEALRAYDGAYVVVSHDAFFLHAVVDQYWAVAGGKLQIFAGDEFDAAKEFTYGIV